MQAVNNSRHRAVNYLTRRQKEPLDVFAERLARAFYENYIGSIVDWYSSTLFHREPSLQYEEDRSLEESSCRSCRTIATGGNHSVGFLSRSVQKRFSGGAHAYPDRFSASCFRSFQSG